MASFIIITFFVAAIYFDILCIWALLDGFCIFFLFNQIAAQVFNNFSFMFLKLSVTCAFWAFADLVLYVFGARNTYNTKFVIYL